MDVNIFQNTVNFLSIKIILDNGTLKTTLSTRPAGSHLHLNYISCHPSRLIRYIRKGQFNQNSTNMLRQKLL